MATEILNNCNFDATRIVKLYLATQVSTGGTINFPVNYHTLSGTSDSIIKYESWDATNIVQIGQQLIQFNEVLWVDENISFNEELIIDQRGRNYVKTLTFELSGIDQTLVDQLEALGLDYEGMLCPPKTLAILIDENENELIAGYDFPFRLESITTGINGDQNSITLTYISNSHSRARNAGFPTPSPSPTPSITPSISLSRTPSITPSITPSPQLLPIVGADGCYEFEEISGTIYDCYDNNGLEPYDITFQEQGKINKCIYLPDQAFASGVTTYNYTTFTISCWVKLDDFVTGQTVSSRNIVTFTDDYYVPTLKFFYYGFYNTLWLTSPFYSEGAQGRLDLIGANLQDGQWHHIAVTFDNSDYSTAFYHNGTPLPLFDVTWYIPIIQHSILYLGYHSVGGTGSNNSTRGWIDSLAFWNRVLTESEILDVYNDGYGSICCAPIPSPSVTPSITPSISFSATRTPSPTPSS